MASPSGQAVLQLRRAPKLTASLLICMAPGALRWSLFAHYSDGVLVGSATAQTSGSSACAPGASLLGRNPEESLHLCMAPGARLNSLVACYPGSALVGWAARVASLSIASVELAFCTCCKVL